MITMIIKKCFKLYPSVCRVGFHEHIIKYSFCKQTQITNQVRADLVQKLKSMDLRFQKSILLQEDITAQQAQNQQKKKFKYIHKILSKQQKLELGLMIPQSVFSVRMTRAAQQQYREIICQKLYNLQKEKLQPFVRILQMQNTQTNIDQYINSIYKDIFARYIVSRGCGVQWQAHNSSYGVMNSAEIDKQSEQKTILQFYKWIISFLANYSLQKKQILGLYSYKMSKFLPIANVDVENVFKIGYFFTLELTSFGRFTESFQVLKDRDQKIQLLVMVQDPLKLLNIQAICFEPNKKMIIISKFINSNKGQIQQSEKNKINSYLITSMDIYTDHKEYFDQNGYIKHSIFEAQHLLQMKAEKQIKMVKQIEGYSRKGGLYVIDRFSGLPDFERSYYYDLQSKGNYIDKDGRILGLKNNQQIYITDPNYIQKVLKIYENDIHFQKQNFYSTFEDQIYSYQDQKLHFKTTEKYVLPIPQSHYQQIEKAVSQAILEQSKIKIPKLKPSYPKPRDRRHHKKQIKQKLLQQTQYMTLKDCLMQTTELSFSKIESSPNDLIMPIFISKNFQNQKQNQQIIINPRIKQILIQCLKIKKTASENKMDNSKQNIVVQWDIFLLNKHLEVLKKQQKQNNIQIFVKYVPLSQNLLNGFKCFMNYANQSQLSNIVIQPQSKTEDVVPFYFHLHFFIHKMIIKNKSKQQIGRRSRLTKNLKISNKLFSLIKFHPTIHESQKNRNVQQILFGMIKANNQKQYGYGLQALRLWVARKDSYLGDRTLIDKQINKQMQIATFIRKLYWEILPLVNINLNKTIFRNSTQQLQINSQLDELSRQKLPYLHNFIIDHINYYILNMEQCYTKLNLTRAIRLTEDFFKNYVYEIFVKNIRKRIINYPLNQQNKQHIYVLKKILGLLAVISPLLPYSIHHISKAQILQWPEIKFNEVKTQLIPNYNRMTKLRVEVRNKFLLNNFAHSELVIPINSNEQRRMEINGNSLSDIWKLSKQDIQLFFDIENISLGQPKQQGRSFRLKLTDKHPLSEVRAIKFYQYKDICVRCSPQKHYGTHLCQKCLDYLNSNLKKSLPIH